MRKTIAGLIAAVAFTSAMAVSSAKACVVTDPCGGYGYYGYYGYGVRERLPDPAGPQYYWVNQGPTFTGPGNFAPVPTYQERAVIGSRYYGRPYRYGYDGGPYGNATNHYYDGAPGVGGAAVYSYRFPRHYQYRSHYRSHYRTHFSSYRGAPNSHYAKRSYGHTAAHGSRGYRGRPQQHHMH